MIRRLSRRQRVVVQQPEAEEKAPKISVDEFEKRWLGASGDAHSENTHRTASSSSEENDDAASEVSGMTKNTSVGCSVAAAVDMDAFFWTEQCELAAERYGSSSLRVADALYHRGVALIQEEDWDEAIQSLATAIGVYEQRRGKASMGAARCLHKLSEAALRQGDYVLAQDAAYRSFMIRIFDLGPFHADTIEAYNLVAKCYLKRRDIDEALRCFLEVLKAQEALYGKRHVAAARTASIIGKIYVGLKRFGSAEAYFRRSLYSYQSISGMRQHILQIEKELARLPINGVET